jgi:hypothetical protein
VSTIASGGVSALRELGFKGRAAAYKPPGEYDFSQFYMKRGRPPEDQRGREQTPDCEHHYQGYSDECWPVHRRRRKAAAQNGSPDRLTGEVKTHLRYLASNSRRADAEKDYITPDGVKLCISTENPHLNTSDLETLGVGYYGEKGSNGEEHPNVKRIRDCGMSCKWDCLSFWTKMTGQAECRLHYCPHCLTDIGRDLDRARLPDIDPESGAAYRSVWLIGKYTLPESLPNWEGELASLQKQWESALTKTQRRKSTKGSVLWRSFTAYYTLNECWIHWKVMVKEGAPHGADDAVTELCRAMNAEVYDDRRYVHGELASLQLIENARTHLLGFSEDIDYEEKFELFTAHLDATKGRHIFQGMGSLWALLRELPEPEPLVCDECGSRLHRIVEREPMRGQPAQGDTPLGRAPPRWNGGPGGGP